MTKRPYMWALCAATALTAVPAAAQTEPAPSAVANEPRTQVEPSAPGTPAASSQQMLTGEPDNSGDVVVTAQRRSERLIDVPIAVTAVTPQQMTSGGVTSSTDLDRVTPGLVMATQASHAQPNVRGVGSALTGPGADNNVAVYVDGVYQASQSSLIFDFNNVQQIEVLKGPQGTLFGRNATGGAITVKTIDPGFTPEARIAASYGRFEDWSAQAYINVPLGEKAAFNVAGLFRDQGGYITNLFYGTKIDGIKQIAFNGKLLLQPTESFRVIVSGMYSDRDDKKSETLSPYGGPTAAYIAFPSLRLPQAYEANQNMEPIYNIHTRSGSLRAELDLEAGTISAITGYISYYGNLGYDLDQSPLAVSAAGFNPATGSPTGLFVTSGFSPIFDSSKTFSQELNFASEKFGAFSFVAGLYYYRDIARRYQPLTTTSGPAAGTIFLATRSNIRTEAYAGYAEGNLELADRVHLTAGIRYSWEKKEGKGTRTIGAGTNVALEKSWDAFTPRVALRFELSDSANIYGSYSRGFKSGVFNVAGLQPNVIDPENIDAFEVGFKTSSPVFRLSASAFYYKYKNIQVQSQQSAQTLLYQNAAKATIYGGDFDFRVMPTDSLTFNGGIAYTHGRYDEFPGALTTTRNPVTRQVTLVPCAPPAGNAANCDASGNVRERAPEWQANIGVTYNYRTESGTFGATSTLSFLDRYFVSPDNRVAIPSSTQWSGELSYTTPDDRFRIGLWGKNLLNEIRLLYLTTGGSGDLGNYDIPRTYGVSVGAKF